MYIVSPIQTYNDDNNKTYNDDNNKSNNVINDVFIDKLELSVCRAQNMPKKY